MICINDLKITNLINNNNATKYTTNGTNEIGLVNEVIKKHKLIMETQITYRNRITFNRSVRSTE